MPATNDHRSYGASEYTAIQFAKYCTDEEQLKIVDGEKKVAFESKHIVGFHPSNQLQMLKDLVKTRTAILNIRKHVLKAKLAQSEANTNPAEQKDLIKWQSLATIVGTVSVTIPIGLVFWKVLD